MNIYVGNLNYRTDGNRLREVFESYGRVDSAVIINDKETGRSKGFGFVEMPDVQAGIKAIEELNGAEVDGRNLTVNTAKERNNS